MTMVSSAAIRETAIGGLLEQMRTFLTSRQIPAWVVGGFVRDMHLGLPTEDADLVVDSPTVEALGRLFADEIGGGFYILDEKRRYVRVLAPPSRGGQRARLDITPLHGGIVDDLSHRDFTVNALAVPIDALYEPDALIDPLGGCADLEHGVLRAVHANIFVDDGIRLIRLARLTSHLGFSPDGATIALARHAAAHVTDGSPERLQHELCRLFALRDSKSALRLLDDLGILSQILPELDQTRDVSQPGGHYWDVFNHLVETVGFMDRLLHVESRSTDPILTQMRWNEDVEAYFKQDVSGNVNRASLTKLACLLHDIAKPQTKSVDASGKTRFLGHPEQGADIVESVMERLHFSRRALAYVSLVVRQHLRPMQLSNGLDNLPTTRALYRYRRDLGDAALGALWLSMADYLAAKGPKLDVHEWQGRVSHCSLIMESILAEPNQDVPARPPFDGLTLMEALDVGPGPQLGRVLGAVREAFAVGEVSTREEAIAHARHEWETRFGPLRGERGDNGVRRGN